MMLVLDARQFDFKWQHLHIKPLCEADFSLYLTLYSNKQVMQFICDPLSIEKASISFAHALKLNADSFTERLFLTVRLDDEQDPVALCSISHLDRSNQIAELGCIVSPASYKRKIAHFALHALAQQIADNLTIKEFILDIHPENLAACRLANSLGYKKCPSRANIYFRCNSAGIKTT